MATIAVSNRTLNLGLQSEDTEERYREVCKFFGCDETRHDGSLTLMGAN
jgi:hypothetical protein